ncbi:MAG: glycine--tRNA ligase subunit beta [Kordiimonadaceae bacterium]|jgi:glycyl-tRNA synthetase beta chain|nr:glycine--tRNA ligase subunit beta [Kordiimonadaceae bacterium]MBT6032607.1 glycine--tRNA ligase subunit beta [Kordiimonadaceae bacterium]
MSEFLLEIFSEEIPARMQEKAAKDLTRLVTDKLKEAKLDHSGVAAYVTARRLTLHIAEIATEQPDVSEERRGPRADAPEKAIEGFLRSAGLTQDQLVEREDKKGTFLYAVIDQKGRPAKDVIAEFMPEIIRNFPWPKSQRWGDGVLKWVRPMHSILCLLDGTVIDFELDHISSGNATRGHRFMAPDEITISSFDQYQNALKEAFVLIDREERMNLIEKGAAKLAADAGQQIVEDKALLGEVAGLAEYPVVMMGTYDEEFLDVPPEALTSAMRTHQKYFSLKDVNGKLANNFIFVSNMKTTDNGAKIIDGNERVLRARLSDTKFFWDQDLKSSLADRLPALNEIVFHAKLGTVGARVKRLSALSGYIAELTGVDKNKSELAATLSKSDLVTGMVDECPELQGLMGKYFALAEGIDGDIASAIAEHYSPKGPSDKCPSEPVSIAVALAEKVDTLVGFFGIDEKPTGSKDPFALRRASLGIIRLIIENNVRIDLNNAIVRSAELYQFDFDIDDLLNFFWDRLKVYSKDKGVRHDIIGAEFNWDFVKLMAKAEALQNFVSTDDGENLLAGYKRAANILKAEEKKDGISYQGNVTVSLLEMAQEKDIHSALNDVEEKVSNDVRNEHFEEAMTHLSTLRGPIDNFFDKVTVNSDNKDTRINRLKLLSHIRTTMNLVADFSKIES